MSTTALAVELLVIGYQTLVWLALAICLSPLCDNALLQTMKDWKELTVFASVVTAYTSGAIMNGVSTRIISWFENKVYSKRSQKPSEMRAAILLHNPEALAQIMKYFEVPRVLRSTIFNILLIGIFSVLHVFSLWIALLFALGTAAAAWAWYETTENYYIHLSKTYDALKTLGKES